MKILKLFLLACLIFISNLSFSQSDDPVLFTLGNESVTKSEFEYVFKKNNAGKASFTKEELKDYLNLYINFKLKVKEAFALQIDTIPGVKNELDTYKNQLVSSYLEKEILPALLKKTYTRLQEDIRVSHILIEVKPDAAPADTLKAYNEIMEIRRRLLRGENFEKIALEKSQDQYVKSNKGDLGFFTAMQIPFYSFENAAYETAVGKISMPVKTRFGYHLLKVTERRPAAGQMQVAHILIRTDENATPEQIKSAEKKADDIYKRIIAGESFEELAKTMSEDQSSASGGGLLPPFGTGRMVVDFEKAAISLKNDGDVAKPLKTSYGFHIIKRISRTPIPDFDEMAEELKRNVMKEERYVMAKSDLIENYKRKLGYMEFPARMNEVKALVDSSIYMIEFYPSDISAFDKTLFVIDNKNILQKDFIRYISINQRKIRSGSLESIVDRHYAAFVEEILIDHGLSKTYPDYARLKQEYIDGIVMFEMMEKKVWGKAIEDTAGLRNFYESNKNNYMWKDRIVVDVFTIDNEKLARKVQKKAAKSTNDQLLTSFNKKSRVIQIKEGTFERGTNESMDKLTWQPSWSEMAISEEGKVTLIRVNKVIPPTPKALNEARGFHIADYQEYLEKEWITSLRKQYPVNINEDVLNKLFY